MKTFKKLLADFSIRRQKIPWDDWDGDMRSRVFWQCLMFESIIIQELNLPSSGIASLEDRIPIPKFIHYQSSSGSLEACSLSKQYDSNYQYHFLAQVAHRLLLSRIRDSLFFHCMSLDSVPIVMLWRSFSPSDNQQFPFCSHRCGAASPAESMAEKSSRDNRDFHRGLPTQTWNSSGCNAQHHAPWPLSYCEISPWTTVSI